MITGCLMMLQCVARPREREKREQQLNGSTKRVPSQQAGWRLLQLRLQLQPASPELEATRA